VTRGIVWGQSTAVNSSGNRSAKCAVAEPLCSSLKKEQIKKQIYKNCDLAIAELTDDLDASTASRSATYNANPVPIVIVRP